MQLQGRISSPSHDEQPAGRAFDLQHRQHNASRSHQACSNKAASRCVCAAFAQASDGGAAAGSSNEGRRVRERGLERREEAPPWAPVPSRDVELPAPRCAPCRLAPVKHLPSTLATKGRRGWEGRSAATGQTEPDGHRHSSLVTFAQIAS